MWRSYILVVLRACSEMRQQLALEVVQPVLFCFAFFFSVSLYPVCTASSRNACAASPSFLAPFPGALVRLRLLTPS